MRYVFPVIGYIKACLNANFSLYLKKAALGSRSIVYAKKAFYVVSVSAFIFFEKLDNFCKNINCELLIDSNVYEHQGGARNSKVRRSFTKTIKSIGCYIKVPLTIPKVWLADSGQQCQDLILHPSRTLHRVLSIASILCL